MAAEAAAARNELMRYLDPRVLARIDRLDLRSRLVVEGFMAGLHRSPYQGLSVEFAQHREYVPGDDIRHVDWKVFSRTDRFYIKQYEEETNLRCMFLLDVSESMKYAGRSAAGAGLSKYHYGACIAASLSLLLLHQQDAPGLVTFDEDVVDALAPSANPAQIRTLVHHLERAAARLTAKTAMDRVLMKVAGTLGRRGLVCLISDLLVDDERPMFKALRRMAHQGHDVMVLHVLDEDELTFPFEGNTRFLGLEDAGELVAQPRSLRDGYLAALRSYIATVRRECIAQRIGYTTVSTADNLAGVLGSFLSRRLEAGRKASSKYR